MTPDKTVDDAFLSVLDPHRTRVRNQSLAAALVRFGGMVTLDEHIRFLVRMEMDKAALQKRWWWVRR